MNTILIAQALRLLADAIETPANADLPAPSQPPAETASNAPATQPAKPRGRPPGSPNKPAAPAATPAVAAPAAATPSATATSASTAHANGGLTHAIVANDFKAAALAHGRDFVKGLLDAHKAPTFDKVTDLTAFQAQLKAGPQAKPAAPTADGADLLG